MIPDVEDIVDGLIAGTVSREQALAWLVQHMQLAAEGADEVGALDGFAMAIIEGVHANRGQLPEAQIGPAATYAYKVARAMAKARDTDDGT